MAQSLQSSGSLNTDDSNAGYRQSEVPAEEGQTYDAGEGAGAYEQNQPEEYNEDAQYANQQTAGGEELNYQPQHGVEDNLRYRQPHENSNLRYQQQNEGDNAESGYQDGQDGQDDQDGGNQQTYNQNSQQEYNDNRQEPPQQAEYEQGEQTRSRYVPHQHHYSSSKGPIGYNSNQQHYEPMQKDIYTPHASNQNNHPQTAYGGAAGGPYDAHQYSSSLNSFSAPGAGYEAPHIPSSSKAK